MPTNITSRLRGLAPERRRIFGTVTAHNTDGTSTLQLPEGTYTRVRGQLDVVPPYRCFVLDGTVETQVNTANLTPVATEG